MNRNTSLKNGMWHYLHGNYSHADTHLTEILYNNPEDLSALFLEVKVCLSAGLYEDGIIHCDKILKQDLDPILEALCFIFMGCCYEGLNESEKAHFYFNLAENCPQTKPELYYHQTIIYKIMGKYEHSLEASKKALVCIPLGYGHLGIPELEDMKISMKHTMNNYKGTAHAMLKQYKEAIDSFHTAIKLAQSNSEWIIDRADSWVGLGLVYYLNHQYPEAIEFFQTALKFDPKNLVNLECLRRAYLDSDQEEKAWEIQVKIHELVKTVNEDEDIDME